MACHFFQADIVFEYIASSVQQKLWSKVTSLKMYSSIYGAPSSQNSRVRDSNKLTVQERF